jgi:hypothetical protein
MIKHWGRHTNINFYFNLQNQLNHFNGGLEMNMRKAARHLGNVDLLNPYRWRGKHFHHHGGGVCWLLVLLWIDSWRHELIVSKKWYKNNLKMRLMVLLFVPSKTVIVCAPLHCWCRHYLCCHHHCHRRRQHCPQHCHHWLALSPSLSSLLS